MVRRSDAPVRKTSAAVQVIAIEGDSRVRRPDRVVTEEPMEIRLHGPGEAPRSVAVTLRTPGHDFELAVGFCVSEGLVRSRDDLVSIEYCVGPDGEQEYNIVTIARRTVVGEAIRPRAFAATASCGLCGKAALDDLAVVCAPVDDDVVVPWSVLRTLPATLGESQPLFSATGGLHGVAVFDAAGVLQVAREDVGRHNAVDKVVGRALLDGHLPLSGRVLLLSGRVSFELVQKAAVARVPIVAAVGAPSSLAVDAARELGVTIVGFLRGDRANVYSHAERIGS